MNFKEKILSYMKEEAYKPLTFHELLQEFEIESSMKKELLRALNELEDEGSIIFTRSQRYGIPEKMNLIAGTLDGNQKGFAFLRPDNKDISDIFISPVDMNGAMHGDRVIVRPMKTTEEVKSPEGKVIRILERANEYVIGTFQKSKNFGFVVPDDKKIAFDIFIPGDEFNGAKTNEKVNVKITEWPDKRKNPEGKIVEIIGDIEDTRTHIEAVLLDRKVRQVFPEDVIKEAIRVSSEGIHEQEYKRRKDLRDLNIITIDGEDAKDLDDAVYVEKINDDEYMLGVHIADVTHYVKEGRSLDKEALKRATSIYISDRVIPMLPKELSNGVCSLNPGEDKLTLSVEMIINKEGKVTDYKIFESILKNRYRMTYTDVSEILENNDEELSEKYKEILPMLKNMEELSLILRRKRELRGAIDFEFPETKIITDETGKATDVTKYERRVSNKIIEEFMLACNETVAEHYYWLNMPFVYRIHEDPDEEKMHEFSILIHNLGYALKGSNEVHPRELQQLLLKIKGKKEESLINNMMLRSLRKAIYSPESSEHFGLAAQYYCHFTSPIRRYPDLQIHRIIKGQLNGKLSEDDYHRLSERTAIVAEQSSKMERIADEIERDVDKIKIAEYMSDKIGEKYSGVISGVTSFGVFVELENTVEGLVHISNMVDDFYIFDNEKRELFGQTSRKVYRIGEDVKVKVLNVSIAKAEIDFVFISNFTEVKMNEEKDLIEV
ncbi:ribonuclease R [Sedimentibacter hydroxybenzoicus DSM 7310]|uniref:Ribonuclease R n=1 Tax=Sedimentibacter hydroxybenzoicus DSM 7310 TaxID=1123245 RepID=A0A974BMD1_SEDHY|nr:ribonuclease R [Sedimentibacter hydroxybenzoicus]NYB75481.1 ribonuclease R [Sedimentibacter hydroxybenzoicus DSM 7310]